MENNLLQVFSLGHKCLFREVPERHVPKHATEWKPGWTSWANMRTEPVVRLEHNSKFTSTPKQTSKEARLCILSLLRKGETKQYDTLNNVMFCIMEFCVSIKTHIPIPSNGQRQRGKSDLETVDNGDTLWRHSYIPTVCIVHIRTILPRFLGPLITTWAISLWKQWLEKKRQFCCPPFLLKRSKAAVLNLPKAVTH